ncbi:hypothetical protein K2Z83_25710, partial [Oscillochloris sp. ZM17-4]|nr:hypothetical protein [Oscillochloris sp. ZM17-4]
MLNVELGHSTFNIQHYSGGAMRRLLALAALLLVFALAPAAPARAEGAALEVSPASAPQGAPVTVSLSGFAPREVVSLWLTLPDYRVEAIGDLAADVGGAASYDLAISVGMPVGAYGVS